MNTAIPETVETTTGEPVTHSVIWLHGLGADGNDFMPLVPELGLPTGAGVRFVFPHAPVRPITVNGGMPMRAWFDLASPAIVEDEDTAGIDAAAARLEALVARENDRGVPDGRILVAGFSQGGAVALHLALHTDRPLAGVIALSTWLPLADRAPRPRVRPPVFMAHGDHDPVVAPRLAMQSKARLEEAGLVVDWHGYAMDHSVCREEVADLGDWLGKRLGAG